MVQPDMAVDRRFELGLFQVVKENGVFKPQKFGVGPEVTDFLENRAVNANAYRMLGLVPEHRFHFWPGLGFKCTKVVVQLAIDQSRGYHRELVVNRSLDHVFNPLGWNNEVVVHNDAPFGLQMQNALVPRNTAGLVGLVVNAPSQGQR